MTEKRRTDRIILCIRGNKNKETVTKERIATEKKDSVILYPYILRFMAKDCLLYYIYICVL